jgi:phosphotransferase system HPr-like phosphotransfer protein
VKIKMDDAGNILIKRVSKCNVYIKNTGQDDENAIGNEILKLANCALEPEKPVKVNAHGSWWSGLNFI